MKIIGHRGAAGLALENTLPSIELARLLGVDTIEFDVRKTADDQLVLCHDVDLSRISGSDAVVGQLTLKELQSITLSDEHSVVPTLKQALRMAHPTPVIIELKEHGCVPQLLELLEGFRSHDITVASFKHGELAELRARRPDLKLFGLERTKPFDIIQTARSLRLNGVGMIFWLLNPLTYWMIKRSKLDLYVYTLNFRTVGRFVRLLYPDAAICTDHPEWYIKHPWLKLRSGAQLWAPKSKQNKRRKRRLQR
jgi:glycerophosphoryl diester phosphodiesterase